MKEKNVMARREKKEKKLAKVFVEHYAPNHMPGPKRQWSVLKKYLNNILLTRFHNDFFKGNSKKGHNSDKKKAKTCQLFLFDESIHEISKL